MFPKRPGKVEGELEPGMFFEALEERPVAVLERLIDNEFEISDGLVAVNGEEETEFLHAGTSAE
jgi:hypothetical protein